jgi:hypothetical protein
METDHSVIYITTTHPTDFSCFFHVYRDEAQNRKIFLLVNVPMKAISSFIMLCHLYNSLIHDTGYPHRISKGVNLPTQSYRICKEDPIYVFLPIEMKLRGLVPNFYIHVSVRDL